MPCGIKCDMIVPYCFVTRYGEMEQFFSPSGIDNYREQNALLKYSDLAGKFRAKGMAIKLFSVFFT